MIPSVLDLANWLDKKGYHKLYLVFYWSPWGIAERGLERFGRYIWGINGRVGNNLNDN